MRWSAGLALVLVAMVALAAAAGASVYGSSGVWQTPRADVPSPGTAVASWHRLPGGSVLSLTGVPTERLEIGLVWMAKDRAAPSWNGYMKGQLKPETAELPAVAIGFEDGAGYVVLSRRVSSRLRAHLGAGAVLGGPPDSRPVRLKGIFGGVTFLVNPVAVRGTGRGFDVPRTVLFGEYDGVSTNAGVRLDFHQGYALHVAIVDWSSAALGLSYRIQF